LYDFFATVVFAMEHSPDTGARRIFFMAKQTTKLKTAPHSWLGICASVLLLPYWPTANKLWQPRCRPPDTNS